MKIRLTLLIMVLFGALVSRAQSTSDYSEEVIGIAQTSSAKGLHEPVIFIGSSSIRMWEGLQDDFPGFPVLNHGFGGSEFTDLIEYQEQLIEEFEPSMIVVYSGDNDIAFGKGFDEVAIDAETYIDGLKRAANGALVVVISVKPSIARWEHKEQYIELNALLNQMAQNLEHMVFVDVWTPMLNKKGEPNKRLFTQDGLHMNEKGYEIWKNALIPYLSR